MAPQVEGGRYPVKRIVGDTLTVEADVFVDGTDALAAVLLHRKQGDPGWTETVMEALGNDRWRASLSLPDLGRYEYTIRAWVDPFETWRQRFRKRVSASQDTRVEQRIGAQFLRDASAGAATTEARRLREWASRLEKAQDSAAALRILERAELQTSMTAHGERRWPSTYEPALAAVVDPPMARFSTWYELFPRSTSPDPDRPGTLRDCAKRLSYVAEMGFDVVYLPPIHPIGRTHRRGPNNEPASDDSAVGSPWAIGSSEGGHKSVNPDLGTLEDVHLLVREARRLGLEVALDMAFQCSPDHPYVHEHPEWFRRRPDGTIQFAENPPKKYEDIYPFDFETESWRDLWQELKSIVLFWVEQGIRIFRVDNPHTKPFAFWQWLVEEVKRDHPDVLFLSEAFTRPKVMHRLAQVGFSQSYTYFAWRNTKREFEEYFTELTRGEVPEYFRPSLWTNTPDILTAYLQEGGRPAFLVRLVLAATLGANYGIYGPAFELMEDRPREPGSEEYLNSEKYEVKHWDVDRADSLRPVIGLVNHARRDNAALQQDGTLHFHPVDNDQLLCYSKSAGDNVVLVVVNLDPLHTQSGWVDLELEPLGLRRDQPFQVHDLLTGATYGWRGSRNYVELRPKEMPAHLFRVDASAEDGRGP